MTETIPKLNLNHINRLRDVHYKVHSKMSVAPKTTRELLKMRLLQDDGNGAIASTGRVLRHAKCSLTNTGRAALEQAITEGRIRR